MTCELERLPKDFPLDHPSRHNKLLSSWLLATVSLPLVSDGLGRVGLKGINMPLQFEEEYPERFVRVGEPVRTRDKIGRQQGRQSSIEATIEIVKITDDFIIPHRQRLCYSLSPSRYLLEQKSRVNEDLHSPERRDGHSR